MSLITDIRAVSGNAVEQLAARFAELPRPLLAAIGAGDMALERLAELRESLADAVGDRVSTPAIDVTDVRSAASDLGSRVSDLPSRAQKIAADVAGGFEQFAAEAPAKAQEMIAQLPDKLAEIQAAAQSLSPDAVKETVDAYTNLAGMIYGNLADRGDKTWTKVRSAGVYPGLVVGSVAAKAGPAAPAAAPAPARASSPGAAAVSRAQAPVVATTPKAPRAAALKPAAVKPTAVMPTAGRPAAVKRTTAKPAAVKPATLKPAAKRAAGKSSDKVVPTAAPRFVAARQTVRKSAGRATVMPVVETVVVTPTGPGV